MKFFTCTDRAISLGAAKNKLFIVIDESELHGRTRYTAIALDITAVGVRHNRSGKESTIDDLKDISPRILSTMLTRDVSFEASVFFKQISISELQTKVEVLQKLKAAQDFEFQDLPRSTRTWFANRELDDALFVQTDHSKAMALFANLEVVADEDAEWNAIKAKIEANGEARELSKKGGSLKDFE